MKLYEITHLSNGKVKTIRASGHQPRLTIEQLNRRRDQFGAPRIENIIAFEVLRDAV